MAFVRLCLVKGLLQARGAQQQDVAVANIHSSGSYDDAALQLTADSLLVNPLSQEFQRCREAKSQPKKELLGPCCFALNRDTARLAMACPKPRSTKANFSGGRVRMGLVARELRLRGRQGQTWPAPCRAPFENTTGTVVTASQGQVRRWLWVPLETKLLKQGAITAGCSLSRSHCFLCRRTCRLAISRRRAVPHATRSKDLQDPSSHRNLQVQSKKNAASSLETENGVPLLDREALPQTGSQGQSKISSGKRRAPESVLRTS